MYSLSDYDYVLPEDLVAQKPAPKRDHANLLVLDRDSGEIDHRRFYDIQDLLTPGDVLVVNDTKVIPARFYGRKSTGGKVEMLLLDYSGSQGAADRITANCLIKASKTPRPGSLLQFSMGLSAQVLEVNNGHCKLQFQCRQPFDDILDRIGMMPLPPYIKRPDHTHAQADRNAYQTVYASRKGAVAAPTAGLHFSRQLLDRLTAHGVKVVALTLHIGYGTFKPVRVSDIRDHHMHHERFAISAATAAVINQAKADGRRVMAVGTTSVRTLEYAAAADGSIHEGRGQCDLFIYPGYRFKVIDAMITNFHLPRSTLMMLVSAFAGRENILNAYQTAIERRYRFYSYGDAMMIR
jgi:S-adenosylmethionine:tRNA ribosyltransferase-isomerase